MAGMVTSGILFAINTTGGGKAKLAFAAVAVGLVLVGKKLNEARLNAEKFADSWVRLDGEQRKVVLSMERATKGLIDTNAEILSVHKFTEAGMTANAKLMEAVGLIAVDRAKKMGEGAAGATERVVKLTDAITKGQTRALKEYGIDLENTEDLILAQEEAMVKVIARSEGLTAEIQTLSEQTYALNNNWETFLGLSVGRAGTIGVLGGLNEAFSTLNESLMSSDDGLAEATLSMEQFGKSVAGDILDMVGFEEAAWRMNSELGRMIELQGQLKKSRAARAAIPEYLEMRAWMKANPYQTAAIGAAGLDLEEMRTMIKGQMTAEKREVLTSGAPKEPKAPKGAGKAAAPALVGEAAWSAELAMDQARKEEQIAHNEWRLINDAEYLDDMIQQEMDADAELEQQQWDAMMSRKDAEMEMVALSQETKWAMQLGADEAAEAQAEQHHNWLLAHSEQYAKKQAEIDKAAALARLGQFKGMFTNLSSLMQLENKKAFYIGKAAAYAATVINTAEAAMASFKAMAGIPYVGPALGAVAAATAVAAGAVQLVTIKKQKFGSSGGGVSAGPVGSTGGGYLGGGGNYAAGGAGGVQPTYVTVILGEEEFHGWSIKANQEASQKGDPAFTEEAA